jgi:hypothetical protein
MLAVVAGLGGTIMALLLCVVGRMVIRRRRRPFHRPEHEMINLAPAIELTPISRGEPPRETWSFSITRGPVP